MAVDSEHQTSKWERIKKRVLSSWDYCYSGVWNDTRSTWKVNMIKTVNLSVQSFMSRDLQTRAAALTYQTILAIVPALAILFAIGRGFGFQKLLENDLIQIFPSQEHILRESFNFVDSYLAQASGGVFVGVGIVFLLWTLVSLLSNVEASFNVIWQVPNGRSIWRQLTDYLAIFMILPILMICSSGLGLFMTTSLKTLLPFGFLDEAISVLIDILGVVLSWLFFAGTYILIPNTKVKPLNAIIAGIFVGTAFQILQWLFVSGQLYVSKYNAIYGSFSFLPLFLIWMQLVWLITLIGGVICYASQNIKEYNFGNNIKNISLSYKRMVTLAVLTLIVRRFKDGSSPLTAAELSQVYDLPVNLVTPITVRLREIGLIAFIQPDDKSKKQPTLQPAVDISTLTLGKAIGMLQYAGDSNFIPNFDIRFNHLTAVCSDAFDALIDKADETLLYDIDITNPLNNNIQS